MADLAYRQTKIQEKRKQTSFRDFVMEICSWYPLNIYNVNGMLTRYPDTPRRGIVVSDPLISRNNDQIGEYTGNFFADFQRLYDISKKSSLITTKQNENSAYTDGIFGVKNGYLGFGLGFEVENVLYSIYTVENCKNVMNSLSITHNSDNIFDSKNVRQSFNIFYSCNIDNASDLRFCANCTGCHHCIDCDNLMNQSYCIANRQLSKEEYQRKKAELLRATSSFDWKKQETFMKMGNVNSPNSTRIGVVNSQNITDGYLVFHARDSKNVVLFEWGDRGSSEHYDSIDIGVNADHCYAVCAVGPAEHCYCEIFSGDQCSHCFYCMNMGNCSFCLWCSGLSNKSYCIFNKQYTKEERHTKVDEIFTQMEKDWTLWAFFPPTMNPFYFNDTAAYLIDPTFTKEEVEAAWYLRRDEPIKVDIPAGLEQVSVNELDKYEGFDENGKWYIDEAILKKVILDEQGNARRIVNMEYAFLVKYGLPLPRKHWLDRMKENFKIK